MHWHQRRSTRAASHRSANADDSTIGAGDIEFYGVESTAIDWHHLFTAAYVHPLGLQRVVMTPQRSVHAGPCALVTVQEPDIRHKIYNNHLARTLNGGALVRAWSLFCAAACCLANAESYQ